MFWMLSKIALWIVPIGIYLWARRAAAPATWRLTGVALGAVLTPALTGLYGLYFLGPITALLGLVALPLLLIHSGVGYDLALWLGWVEPGTVVEPKQSLYVDALNGVVWALVYGALGWILDALRRRKRARQAA